MSSKKQIEPNEWQDRLQTFTSGNRGRIAALDTGGKRLAEDLPLVSVDYDPPGKGNDLMISFEGYTHTVDDPEQLFLIEESNGVVSALEIVAFNGVITHLRLF